MSKPITITVRGDAGPLLEAFLKADGAPLHVKLRREEGAPLEEFVLDPADVEVVDELEETRRALGRIFKIDSKVLDPNKTFRQLAEEEGWSE